VFKTENPFTMYCIVHTKKDVTLRKLLRMGTDILNSLNINCFVNLATGWPWPENGPKRQGKKKKNMEKNKKKKEE